MYRENVMDFLASPIENELEIAVFLRAVVFTQSQLCGVSHLYQGVKTGRARDCGPHFEQSSPHWI